MNVFRATLCVAFFAALAMFRVANSTSLSKPDELIVVTVATEETDGLKRLMRSAQDHGHELLVFGRGEQWNGGDMRYNQGGGQKIRILRESLKSYKDKNAVIMFVDAYDVVINAPKETILDRFFHEFSGARIVFGAEGFCWPDKNLVTKYPLVTFGKRYLNSGLYMGYAADIYKMLEMGADTKDNDDDQLFFTNLYLDEKVRTDLNVALDSISFIFQNLNGASEDVKIEYSASGKAQLINTVYTTEPVVVHGNGPSKTHLNALGNYIGNVYSNKEGCIHCKAQKIFDFERFEVGDHPTVALLAFVHKPVPFVEEFLQTLYQLDYDKKRINFYIYNNQRYNEKEIDEFVAKQGKKYNKVHSDNAAYEIAEREARTVALEWANEVNSDFAFFIDADAHISNPKALKILIEKAINNRLGVIAPMVGQPKKLFTNFWGALSENGYYARSEDYLDIVNLKLKGMWNVPFVTSVVLLTREKMVDLKKGYSYKSDVDPDMSFCSYVRDHGTFLFVDNEHDYGFLIRSEDFEENIGRKNPEMYEIFMNRDLWVKRYVHPKYHQVLEEGFVLDQPCPDVYDFPLMSERFCAEMIVEMEHFGQWSTGKHEDNRLTGGYENVPTRDIHMNQVGFERHWLYFVDEFVRPVQEKVFTGYYHQPVESVMMFVVRYKPEEQPALRPHHDASTYSIDIALNKRGRDYEGGGVRYIRYNCTVAADEVGYSMLFPGRLTHLHEGLPTTKGTRYIAVSFLNP
ncbi:hypothetical protein L596_006603 [Steinernema carpocapsae]|uniref:procollagen-lysine 5-dioxygenase n=1 Tax=Steinernema carpocapsae TaxID=34508 RepID=A0A4U8V5A9_STECR|nr:hypothetical protein L596_006603 [Steinernema carpocapsae]